MTTPVSRRCGACTLCCKIMPIAEIEKAHHQKCPHATVKGCSIYHQGRPRSCVVWSCAWISTPDLTAGFKRPDRAHYIVDSLTDTIRITDNETGESLTLDAVQIWTDPAFPEAYRDPALLAFLARARRPAIIRQGPSKGFTLFPPSITKSGEWVRAVSDPVSREKMFSGPEPIRKAGEP